MLSRSVQKQELTLRGIESPRESAAHHLQSLGVGRNVGGGLPGALARINCGAAGHLESRRAYLALDRSYPSERLAYMLADSRAGCC